MVARLDLLTLKLFAAVIEERSIAGAAERERIAASAVSKRISDLELSLQLPLLVRMHRGVEPTEAGRTLMHHARGILREIDELATALNGFASGTRGQIRILANETSIFGFLPQELGEFLAQHPMVKVDIKSTVSLAVAPAVEENLADLGIFAGDMPTGDLTLFPYHSDRLVVVAAPDHPLVARNVIKLADLLDYDIIEQKRRSSIGLLVLAAAARMGRQLKVRVRVESFDVMCRMAAARLGIGIMPEPFADRFGAALGVRVLRLDEPWAARQHRICVRDVTALPRPARLLITHLVRSVDTSAGHVPSPTAMPA